MMISFKGLSVNEIIGQLVGACSSTRFWSGLPKEYPSGFGIFQDKPARELVMAALQEATPMYHDDQTLIKVYNAMREADISEAQIVTAIHSMQNQGIFFREATPTD